MTRTRRDDAVTPATALTDVAYKEATVAKSQSTTVSNLHVRCALTQCMNNAQNGVVVRGTQFCSADHARKYDALERVWNLLLKEMRQIDPSNAICEVIESDSEIAEIPDIDDFLCDSISDLLDRAPASPAKVLSFSHAS